MHSFELAWLTCGLFLALNRLSAAIFKDEKERIWSRLFFVIVLSAIIVPRLWLYNLSLIASQFVVNSRAFVPVYFVEYLCNKVHQVGERFKHVIQRRFSLRLLMKSMKAL